MAVLPKERRIKKKTAVKLARIIIENYPQILAIKEAFMNQREG